MDLYSFPYVGTVLDLNVIHACIILYLSDACMQILVHARSQVLTGLHALHVVRSIYVFMFSFLMMDFRLTAGRRVLEMTVNVDPGGNIDPRESSFVAVVD